MLNKDYLGPGLAAIALAIIFPSYWGYQALLFTDSNFSGSDLVNVSLDLSDWVFFMLGILEVYIYFSLKRVLADRINFKSIDVLLILIICNSAIFYVGNCAIDLSVFFLSNMSAERQELATKTSFFLSAFCMFMYGMLDLLIAIMLLIKFTILPTWLRVFAITSLVLGILELTFLVEFSIILYPITLLILAIYFLQKPEIIEVV